MAAFPALCGSAAFSQDGPGSVSSPTRPTQDKSDGTGASTAPTAAPAPWTNPEGVKSRAAENAVGATAGRVQGTSPTKAPNPWGSQFSGTVAGPAQSQPAEQAQTVANQTAGATAIAEEPGGPAPTQALTPEQSRFTEYFVLAAACLGLLFAYLLWRTNPPQKSKKEPEA